MAHKPTDDRAVLDMVQRRHAGEDCVSIGRSYGMTPSAIRTMTNRVKDADAASGEDITGAYW